MRILIDMDGCCCNFIDPLLARYNRDYDDNLTAADIKYHGMHEQVKPECGRAIYRYFHDRHLFSTLEPIEGAVEYINKLHEENHEIIFCTKPVDFSLSCVAEKQSWVQKYFPNIGFENMVFTGKKYLVQGDWLIDDLPSNLFHFQGKRILFDQPWNQKPYKAGPFLHDRVKSWEEIYEILS